MIDRPKTPPAWTLVRRCVAWSALGLLLPVVSACVTRTLEAPQTQPTAVVTANFTQKINNDIDILFMIDDSSSMTSMQQKLIQQLPTFMQVLQQLPGGLPSVHVAVVSQDMGAPSDSDIGCTPEGKDGVFQFAAEGTCTSTTLAQGATFISDVDNMPNFTDPIGTVFQCISLLGANGCGFEHQLEAIDRALGADGQGPAPSQNAGFLRDDAYLGIVMLTNEDDCSAPDNTTIYSLNGYPQSITNPDGPIANYRCNGGPRGGHWCQDLNPGSPSTTFATPPLDPPTDASGNPLALTLSNCEDNESGSSALIPVTKFVSDIKALKTDPDDQILVAGIIAPATPYTVQWVPGSGTPTAANELWPQVEHSCGAAGTDDVNPSSTENTTDGSFGDPGVRETQFMNAFQNSVIASICDPTYATSMTEIAQKLGALITPPCITGTVQTDSNGQPLCTVVENVENNNVTQHNAIPNCNENGNQAPCWTLVAGTGTCNGQTLMVNDLAANMNAQSENSTVSCSLCLAGSTEPGC